MSQVQAEEVVVYVENISQMLKKYNNRQRVCLELDRIPRVQTFGCSIVQLAKSFADLKPFVVGDKFGFDEIDQAAVSSRSPALMLTWKKYLLYHKLIQTHRSLFSYVFLAECTAEDVATSKLLQKLQKSAK